jgi:hypothetical protein
MLSKVTFLFFLIVVGMALLIIRTDHSGEKSVRVALAGFLVGSLPTIIIWRFYGMNFMRFAMFAAWSGASNLWQVPDMTPVGYLHRYFGQLGPAIIPLLILIALFVRGFVMEKQLRLARLLPITITLIYLGIAARSQNRDPRFTIPVMIALPLCLAWTSIRKKSTPGVGAAPILASLFIGTLLALPMIGRPQVEPIRRAGELLRKLCQGRPVQGGPVRVVIATDGPESNVNIFQVAEQISLENLAPAHVETIIYDAINKRPPEMGFSSIDAADYVLFLKPNLPQDAEWTRIYAKDYRAHCEKVGTLMDAQTSPDLDVFRIRKAAAQ